MSHTSSNEDKLSYIHVGVAMKMEMVGRAAKCIREAARQFVHLKIFCSITLKEYDNST